jgi:flagellin-like hook-associated protein FlgL
MPGLSINKEKIVAFSINTNVASLQAQNYLRVNSGFQQKTINKVTSGLRIVNSGDDAAGLAIANGMRSDEAVLNQGIRNANDGMSQLQIADGGMSNISQLLDRARTLATQSASGTYTGDRSGLNSEFQSVMGEIDRQAQSIGLNTGGTFAKSLQVFIGGGKGDDGSSVVNNGSVFLDLSASTIDTQSLGLKGFTAGYAPAKSTDPDSGFYDLGASSATSVSSIIAANSPANNQTSFVLSGPGFAAGANGAVTISVNLASVSDSASLTKAINAGIQSAELAGTPSAAALKSANIAAEIHTGSDGHQQLQFTSSNTAFQVTAGDVTANAFMGNFDDNTAGDYNATSDAGGVAVTGGGSDVSAFVSSGTQQYTGVWSNLTADSSTPDSQTFTFSANDSTGKQQTMKVTLTAGTGATDMDAAAAVGAINAALQATDNKALQSIIATTDPTGGHITFTNSSSSPFTVSIGLEAGVDSAKGMANGNTIQTSKNVGQGSTVDINSQATAEQAVTALSNAVGKLGNAQAVVGRGENQFNYAINLAQSQVTNMAAAESQIRDADLAAESANLTKAQILIQAGVAALAQANSAPQQVLSLLQR